MMPPPPRKLTADYARQVRRLADDLAAGRMTLDEWQDAMNTLVGGVHIGAYLAGREVERVDDLNDEAVTALALMIAFQLRKLADWVLQLREPDAAGLAFKRLYDRALLYVATADATFQKAQTDARGMPRLPAFPKDFSSACSHNCFCQWRIQTLDGDGNWDCTWVYDPLRDNCPQCPRRAQVWKPLRIRSFVIQPYDAAGLFVAGREANAV